MTINQKPNTPDLTNSFQSPATPANERTEKDDQISREYGGGPYAQAMAKNQLFPGY